MSKWTVGNRALGERSTDPFGIRIYQPEKANLDRASDRESIVSKKKGRSPDL